MRPGRARAAATGLALALAATALAGCGDEEPAPPRTVGSAVVGPASTEREILSEDDGPFGPDAVAAFFDVELPAGTSGLLARREGFQDDVAVARFTIPAAARRAFARGLGEALDCAAFGRPSVDGLAVGPVPGTAPRATCRTASRPDAGPLAVRRAALVPAGDRVEVLLFGFTT